MAICSRALKSAGLPGKADEMTDRINASDSYDAALVIMMEYCEVT
jgi:hypothetical protein